MAFAFFLLQCLWLILPGVAANMTPVLTKRVLPRLAVPIDGGRSWRGKRILGDHKTVRGLVLGIIAAILITMLQKWLYAFHPIQNISILDYASLPPFLLGFLMGFGVLLGDMIKSFFKRRLDVKPGEKFIPWDQVDAAFGGMLIVWPMFKFSWQVVATVVVMTFCLHILTRYIGYWLKITKTPWA
ncbi:MAG: CDP-archaeol synthase [Nanoarchaeota archaeon]